MHINGCTWPFWTDYTLICLLWHIRAAHIVLIYLLLHIRRIHQQTVQSNAWTFTYGSSPVGDLGQPGLITLLIMQWCTSYFCHLLFYLFTIHAWLVSSRKFVIWVSTCMRDEYQLDRVGLGPLGCMNWSTCRINVTGYLILTGLYKRWRNSCTNVVGSRWWVLKLFYYQLSWQLRQRNWRDCINYLPRLA